MHDRLDKDMARAIEALSDAEKLELIEELAHSLRAAHNGGSEVEAVQRQRDNFRHLQEKLAGLPHGGDPYAHLGYSNEAHDKVLYDLEQK